MKYANRISLAREAAGLTQAELAAKACISVQALQNYEYGKRDLSSSTLSKVADATGRSMAYLLALDTDPSYIEAVRARSYSLPVLGRIAAGTPREAFAQSDEYMQTTEDMYQAHPDAFWLAVSGNSMNRIFPDRALVLIDPTCTVRDGDVAAVFVNGDDATIKRVYFEGDSVRLHPESWDPEYKDRIIDRTDPEAPEFRTIGRAVSYTAPEGWRA